MATPLNIAAQYAEDAFLQNYRVPTDFFNIEDWIFHTAANAAKFYQDLYKAEYAKLKSEGHGDEVVAFSNDFLSSQFLKVEKKDGEVFCKLTERVFSFVYDQSNTGVQNVFVNSPRPSYELERGDIDEFWQYATLPISNRIWWALDGDKIVFKTNGNCNVNEVRVIYVPEINSKKPETELPDGIINDVIAMTVSAMKQLAQNVVEKATLDQNPNKAFETEADLKQAKMSETLRENLVR